MGASDTRLPARPAQGTFISRMLKDGEERESADGSLGFTASGDWLKMRSDIMMVGLTTDNLCGKDMRATQTRRANTGRNLLEDIKLWRLVT